MFAKAGLRLPRVTASLRSTQLVFTRLLIHLHLSSITRPFDFFSYFINAYIRPTDDSLDALLLQNGIERLLRLAEGENLCHEPGQINSARRNKRNRQLVISRTITKTASENCLLVADQTDGKHDVWLAQSGLHEHSASSQRFDASFDARLRSSSIDDYVAALMLAR